MKIEIFLKNLELWNSLVAKQSPKQFDVALFKIWISFEKCLASLFERHATLRSSNNTLTFQDAEHLSKFIKQKNKSYIDYIDCIIRLSPHMFTANPFEIIIKDAVYSSIFENVRAIRNYVAHESTEAKRKLIKRIFSGNERKFVDINTYLRRNSIDANTSNYTYYTDKLKEILEFIDEYDTQ